MSLESLNGFAPNSVKTCLVPRSDEFECEGQRSKVKATRDNINEKLLSNTHWQCILRPAPYALRCKWRQSDVRWHRYVAAGGDGVTAVHAEGGVRDVYVW